MARMSSTSITTTVASTNTGRRSPPSNIAAFGGCRRVQGQCRYAVSAISRRQPDAGLSGIFVPGNAATPHGWRGPATGIPIAPALMRGLDQVADELRDWKLA